MTCSLVATGHAQDEIGSDRAFPLVLWNGEIGHYWLRAYNAAHFDPAQFEGHEIACPPSIARSVQKRQAWFFHGRLAARQALTQYGLAHHEVGIGVFREPIWPGDMIGSITHNDRYAAAIALPGHAHGGIGIDVEARADQTICTALMQTTVNAAELDYLRGLRTALPLAWLLTIVFSAKESFYKAAFRQVGRLFDFSAVEISDLNPSNASLRLTVVEPLSPGLPPGSEHRVSFDFPDQSTVFTTCNLPPMSA